MKTGKSILFILTILFNCSFAFSQSEIIQKVVAKSETVNLNLLWYSINHGIISWEKSDDGSIWREIPGENKKNYVFAADSGLYYRARVNSGTCDPVFSKTTKLEVLNISTDSITFVSQNGATVYSTSDLDPLIYSERGILYDTQPIPNQNSPKIINSKSSASFSTSLQNLSEGVTYFTRTYARNSDGVYFFGNILSFSTLKISVSNIINPTKTSITVFLDIKSTDQPESYGLLFRDQPPDENSGWIEGNFEFENNKVTIRNLSPGSEYYIMPYMRVNDSIYLGDVKKIKTLSDYSGYTVDNSTIIPSHKIVWNSSSTAKKLNPTGTFGDYGRVKRVGNSDTLILVYHGGPAVLDWLNIYMRTSYDNGDSWNPQKVLMNIQNYSDKYWRFSNPEILVLKNGLVLIAYEANAKPDENQSSVQILISRDTCKTFSDTIVYVTGRSWEPSMVELPGGEIEMFWSSEAKWWPGDPVYQEIQQSVSTDNGYSWSEAKTVAYYPEKRDGMPVPLLLQGNKGVIFAIESVNSSLSPYIIKRDLKDDWVLTTSNFNTSPYRWVVNNFSGHGGAPYLLQLPTGEVVLSAHIYRGGDWHQNNYMQVGIGDNNARNFGQFTIPWNLPVNESAVNNSLFLKDNETVVAVSCRMFSNGSSGLYWLEGKIVPR